MKKVVFIMCCIFSTTLFAQQSFFETLESHGKNAEYLNFGQVYVNDKGKQQVGASEPRKVEIKVVDYQGLPGGIEVFTTYKDGETKRTQHYIPVREQIIECVGFPNTSMLLHGAYKRAFIAIDDYVFFVKSIDKNNYDHINISKAFVKKGAALTGSESSGKKKKRKKFGKFLGKLKDATINQGRTDTNVQPTGPEYDALMSQDVKQMVIDYLKKMDAKHSVYSLTAKDKTDLETIQNAAKDYDKMIRDKNDAFWKSPEGQAVLRNRRAGKAHSEDNKVTLKNTGSQTIYVGVSNSSNLGVKIPSGSSVQWSCSRSAYRQTKTVVGNTSSYKSTSQKVYTANSGCGQTVNIN